MNTNQNIDELLNAYIDGELSQRQQTELQRMMNHDKSIAERLAKLQSCSQLLNSLPVDKAPIGLTEQIQASLERRTLLADKSLRDDTAARGARHLLMRQFVAAAAMIALVAVLAAVVYNIIGPLPNSTNTPSDTRTFATAPPNGNTDNEIHTPNINTQPTASPMRFSAKLALTTDSFVAADASLNRALQETGISVRTNIYDADGSRQYSFSTGKTTATRLFAELAGIWHQFDTKTLSLETNRFNQPVIVDAVNPQQLYKIIAQAGTTDVINLAQRYAVVNSSIRSAPYSPLMEYLKSSEYETLISANVKPYLTGPAEGAPEEIDEPKDIDFVITLSAGQ